MTDQQVLEGLRRGVPLECTCVEYHRRLRPVLADLQERSPLVLATMAVAEMNRLDILCGGDPVWAFAEEN